MFKNPRHKKTNTLNKYQVFTKPNLSIKYTLFYGDRDFWKIQNNVLVASLNNGGIKYRDALKPYYLPKKYKLGIEYGDLVLMLLTKFIPNIMHICPKLHQNITLMKISSNKVSDIRIMVLASKCTNI